MTSDPRICSGCGHTIRWTNFLGLRGYWMADEADYPESRSLCIGDPHLEEWKAAHDADPGVLVCFVNVPFPGHAPEVD